MTLVNLIGIVQEKKYNNKWAIRAPFHKDS